MVAEGVGILPRASSGGVAAWPRLIGALKGASQEAPALQSWTDAGDNPGRGGPTLAGDGHAYPPFFLAGGLEKDEKNVTGGVSRFLWSLYESGGVYRDESGSGGNEVLGGSDAGSVGWPPIAEYNLM